MIDNYLIAIFFFVCLFVFFVLSSVLAFNFPLVYQLHCPLMLIFFIWFKIVSVPDHHSLNLNSLLVTRQNDSISPRGSGGGEISP